MATITRSKGKILIQWFVISFTLACVWAIFYEAFNGTSSFITMPDYLLQAKTDSPATWGFIFWGIQAAMAFIEFGVSLAAIGAAGGNK